MLERILVSLALNLIQMLINKASNNLDDNKCEANEDCLSKRIAAKALLEKSRKRGI